MRPLVLASKSPVRQRVLRDAGLVFEVRAADIDEEALGAGHPDPDARARALAVHKAVAVSAHMSDALVIGVDQVGVLADGTFLEKPWDDVHATAQLGRMSGRSHRFISAAALVVNGVVHAQVLESATVHLWSLTAAEIADYVKTKEYSGSCGGYQIENRGARLIERVDGPLHAVLGLPFFGLLAALRTMAA